MAMEAWPRRLAFSDDCSGNLIAVVAVMDAAGKIKVGLQGCLVMKLADRS